MYSNRINTLISYCLDFISLADIGADHGYLLIGIRRLNPSIKLLGVENKVGPFNNLIENIKLNNFENSINVSKSDGLDEVTSDYNAVCLAGMGYNNIKQIIEKNIKKLDFIDNFVIDSHTHIDKIRLFFNKLKYKIIDEDLIFEDGIFYTIIKYEKGEESLSREEIKYGPILFKKRGQVFNDFVKFKINQLELIINNIKNDSKRVETLNEEINTLRSYLNEN